eukprot:scaffold18566_cov17-Tisochrysis_lutea.AAC.2
MEQRGTRTRAPWDNSTPGQETTRSGFSCLVCLQEAPLSNASLSLTVGWDHGQRSVPSPPYCAAHQGQQGSGPCKKCDIRKIQKRNSQGIPRARLVREWQVVAEVLAWMDRAIPAHQNAQQIAGAKSWPLLLWSCVDWRGTRIIWAA